MAAPKPRPKPRTKAEANQSVKQGGARVRKTPEQQKKEDKQNLKDLIEGEVKRNELQRFINREDIRMATGVGKFDDWLEQTEAQFVGSVPSQSPMEATETTRPKLKKVSKRKRRKNKPLDIEK